MPPQNTAARSAPLRTIRREFLVVMLPPEPIPEGLMQLTRQYRDWRGQVSV
jgi:hypothetical protein